MAGPWDMIDKYSIPADDPYAQVPPMHRGTVRQMVEGRMAPPTAAALRNPQTLMMIEHANKIDPEFDSNTWVSRTNSVKDFSSGKSSEMVRSINQALAHTKKLTENMDALANIQYPYMNALKNYANNEVLGKQAVPNFRTNAHAVADEMSKVYKGAGISDAEIHAWERNLSPNMSPEQHQGQIELLMELLHGGVTAIENKRLAAQGKHLVEKSGPLISKEGKAALDHITDVWRKKPEGEAAPMGGASYDDYLAAEAAAKKGAAPGATPAGAASAPIPSPDAEGWITLPGGVRLREKQAAPAVPTMQISPAP